MLKLNIKMLNINVHVNMIKMSNFFKKYNLKMILHILTKHVNSLTVIIIIYKTHNSLNCAVYTAMIIYFKNLIKHFNVRKMINIMKMTLFDNCFNE